MLTRRFVILASLLATMLFLGGCESVKSPPGTITTVILLRHADRYQWEKNLNEKGVERAKTLPAALADIKVDVIYSPDKVRNLDTVKPFIAENGTELRVIDTSGAAEKMVAENPGKTVLWVGNTDNLQSIYGTLGGKDEHPKIYGDIFILTLTDKGLQKVEKRNFGGPGGN